MRMFDLPPAQHSTESARRFPLDDGGCSDIVQSLGCSCPATVDEEHMKWLVYVPAPVALGEF